MELNFTLHRTCDDDTLADVTSEFMLRLNGADLRDFQTEHEAEVFVQGFRRGAVYAAVVAAEFATSTMKDIYKGSDSIERDY